MPKVDREKRRKVRHNRIRSEIRGTPRKPRVCVKKSNRHIYVQAIDDMNHDTIAAASSLSPDLEEEVSNATVETAEKVGALLASDLLEQGYENVVFDRGGYPYHGQVKALADQMREEGLDF
ncbi:50S ribosomal protein L18 [Candidatus Bipolaricaulota bacterium]|nr:50S ribosomal protein L18 [Candidatus Bipolaricaulota bacterium]